MDIVNALGIAIEKEREAQREYRELARQAPDPVSKALLEQLAGDEERHERELSDRLIAIHLMNQS